LQQESRCIPWQGCRWSCPGIQLSALVLSVILITIAGALFSERGTIVTVFILCYALTSFLGGYVSGGFYAGQEGKARRSSLIYRPCHSTTAIVSRAGCSQISG
jgi:hypothetical protein